jgi:branched-chain amino acid aminotransferase
MALPEFSTEQWLQKMLALPRPGAEKVVAFYEHRMGAICRDPRLLLIPLDDHLVHRGDGVFEAIRLMRNRVLQLDAHLRRLEESAAALLLRPPCPWEELRAIILDVARAGNIPDGSLRLFQGRGEGGMGVDPGECRQSSLFALVLQSRPLPESYWENGLTACRSAIPAKQTYLARIKSTNYLPNVLMAMEAGQRGADVTFSYDEHGCLAESAVANVGVVDGEGRLLFPRFQNALPGTMALLAMELAEKDMPVGFADITEDHLFAAREILLFGTTPECVGVTRYEGRPVGNGRPGPVALGLRRTLRAALLDGGTPFR